VTSRDGDRAGPNYAALYFRYTAPMPQVTLDLPDKLTRFLAASGNMERAALEAIALQAYREEEISTGELRRLLGYRTRLQVHAFLKAHGVALQYGLSDLEHDRQEGDAIPAPPKA
jgi:predicted HTH domain antitoxin